MKSFGKRINIYRIQNWSSLDLIGLSFNWKQAISLHDYNILVIHYLL